MSADTKQKLTDKNSNDTYYFNEYNKYNTPILHAYTMNNNGKEQHPSKINIKIEYEKDELKQTAEFVENIFLQPDSNDITRMNEWYINNGKCSNSTTNIYGSSKENVGTLSFEYSPEIKDGIATDNISAKFVIMLNNNKKSHIDAQT